MLNVTLNNELNGIELKFDEKPDDSTLSKIRDNGFRWSVKRRIWYAKQTNDRLAFVNALDSDTVISESEETSEEKSVYDLWNMTRTDEIGDNFEKYHIYANKEIAAIIRKHLRTRFPMCKWSVRIGGYNSIYVSLLESPFAKDSDELRAIAHYAYVFGDSYNYNNSDLYSDYFDVNFYGLYESSIIGYDYRQREATADENRMSEEFATAKHDFEVEEELREKKEFEEYCAAEAERRKKDEEDRIRRKAEVANVEAHARVIDVEPYFILNCIDTGDSKLSSIDEYMGSDLKDVRRYKCRIAHEVHLSADLYDSFAGNLLEKFTFLEHKGCIATDDLRVKSMDDYHKMDADERETVDWYSSDCLAIIVDNAETHNSEIKFIVDPEGYPYARYVYLIDEETIIGGEYQPSQKISAEEYAENVHMAEIIASEDANVRNENPLMKPDDEDFAEYRRLMADRIIENGYRFDAGVVRAVEDIELKCRLYRLLSETEDLQEQFIKADLVENQKITIIHIGEFGMLTISKVHLLGFYFGKYAQYENAVHLVVRHQNKRNEEYIRLYRDVIIYDGWVDVPESLLWNIETKDGVTIKYSVFLSTDEKQYDVILKHFKDNGIRPLINSYRPLF